MKITITIRKDGWCSRPSLDFSIEKGSGSERCFLTKKEVDTASKECTGFLEYCRSIARD